MQSLYIHIPFCEKKCFYCSFVVSIGQAKRVDEYLECLELEASRYKREKLKTLYWGGGTPTFLANDQLARLYGMIQKNFTFSSDMEFSVEANPEGLDLSKAKMLRDLGINRISLGVQTFHEKYLRYLGRCHDRKQVFIAFENLRNAGFDNINVDLMYAFPSQTPGDITADIDQLSALDCEHVSIYMLTIEEPSRFHSQKVQLAEGEVQADYYTLVRNQLEQKGFFQYEVSNFAKKGRESQHNLNYWHGGDYIGLGVGAHSHDQGRRFWNNDRLTDYMNKVQNKEIPTAGEERLDTEKRLREALVFGLRMNRGVNLKDLEERYKVGFDRECKEKIRQLIEQGWLIIDENQLKASPKGQLVLDEISARLI